MKIFKIVTTLIVSFISLIIFSFLLTILFTEINPPYVVLDDGTKGRVMNTENMFLAFLAASVVNLIILILMRLKIKAFINNKNPSLT